MSNPPKIAIIEFPGSNCETESLQAIRESGMIAEEFLWNRPQKELDNYDGFFVIGGFSYEDRSRSGVISSKDALMKGLIKQAKIGKPIIGICNGAQILIESGLIPGLANEELGGALAVNKRQLGGVNLGTGFYNTWVNIKMTGDRNTAFTNVFGDDEYFAVPIAHGEGRFVFDSDVISEMKSNNQLAFSYCDNNGSVIDSFPTNPNGSTHSLAGVTNPSGNVLALMPHPERSQCLKIFESMREYIIMKQEFEYKTLSVIKKPPLITNYITPHNARELLVELIITDNEAVTVEQTLNNLGIVCKISKVNHWEVVIEDGVNVDSVTQKVIESDELFNTNKEKIVTIDSDQDDIHYVLVRYKEDFVGQSKSSSLKSLGVNSVHSLTKGVLWKLTGNLDKILATNIICNYYSQVAYHWKPSQK